MEMKLLPWIQVDIAIEIIGKMIAEQMRQLYKLVDDYERKGYSHDSQQDIDDSEHQRLMARISEFKAEIDQIYAGEGLKELYKKVDEVYAPHLKKQYTPHLKKQYTKGKKPREAVKFFDETKGFGFIRTDEEDGEIFVPASTITDPINEDKSTAGPLTSHAVK